MPTNNGQPNHVPLTNGHYLLFDYSQENFRVVYYSRRTAKSESLEQAIANALGLSLWDKKVKDITRYVRGMDYYKAIAKAKEEETRASTTIL